MSMSPLDRRPRRLQIAMFYYVECETNAHGRVDLQLMRELVDHHDLTVFAIEFDNPDPSRITFVRVPCPRRPMVLMLIAFHFLATVAYLRYRLRTGRRFDVVQFHDVDLPFGQVAYVHFCNRAYRLLPAESRAWNLKRAAKHLEHLVRSLLEPWVFGRADQIVVPSRGLAAEIRDHFGPSAESKVTVIENYVDAPRYRRPADFDREAERGSLGIEREDLVLVFVALGHYERKGLDVLLAALGQLDDPCVKLLVAGGTHGAIAEFTRRAEHLGVAERVVFVPTVEDVRPLLWVADAFVFPTAYETFSLVTYEAAAAGLPLLVTPVHGVVDLLEDGVNGWFIERDPADVARRLNETSRDELRVIGEAAAAAAKRVDRDAFGLSWRRFYEDLDARNRKGEEA